MFGLDFRLLRRYRQIIGILVKYGFQDLLADAGVSWGARVVESILPHQVVENIHKHTKWERIRMAVEELGTTYIKLAQILSNRPDVIPLELVAEFEKLQTHVPPFPGEEAKAIIEEDGFQTMILDMEPLANETIEKELILSLTKKN